MLVFGENLVLENSLATDVVRNSDHAVLRSIAAEVAESRPIERRLKLSSGTRVLVRGRSIRDSPGGVIFEIVAAPQESSTAVSSQCMATAPVEAGGAQAVDGAPMVRTPISRMSPVWPWQTRSRASRSPRYAT